MKSAHHPARPEIVARRGNGFRALIPALLLAVTLAAQSPAVPGGARPDGTGPLPGETIFLPELKGLITVPEAAEADRPVPPGFTGVDTTRTPLLAGLAMAELLGKFLGKPMSFGSLDRLGIAVRTALRVSGHPFVEVHAPPQDVTDGVLRLVVRRARLDGELVVEGARYFPEKSYRAAVPIKAGEEIDAATVQAGVDRLNRNGFRRVVVAAEPGTQAGTTRLVLRAIENKPWAFTAGYNNGGTAVTDESRVTAGWSTGNAFGRGDTLGYSLAADPAFKHSVAHSANYGTVFDAGRSLSVFGSWSEIESVMPPPLTQQGNSWQVGMRFGIPLRKTANGWERSVGFSADFKYSDNSLEFAAVPVTDNVTHVAQFGASFSLSRHAAGRVLSWSASVYASPGGLTGRNKDEAFDVSRFGARAAYVYGRLDGRWQQKLPQNFLFSASVSLQGASGALLGTEQLSAGGSGGVRGYRESTVFSDEGLLVNTELHFPAFALCPGRDQVDAFAFVDAATLRDRGPLPETADIASVGAGVNYRFATHFSLRASYGWQLAEVPDLAESGSSYGHISVSFSF